MPLIYGNVASNFILNCTSFWIGGFFIVPFWRAQSYAKKVKTFLIVTKIFSSPNLHAGVYIQFIIY